MGMFTFTLGGGGLILIGAWETLISSSSSSPSNQDQNQNPLLQSTSRSNPVTILFTSILSFFFTINSIISLLDAIDARDGVGSAIQLQVLAMGSLFLLYSLLGILINFTNLIRLPSSLLNLIALFGFLEEFLMFYLQRKDSSGIENRYFDLLLVPITACVVATLIELKSSKGYYARVARGIGLVLQGTWILQMGLSFYTDLIAHGCSLHEKSRGNYTIRCKGHPEYHTARAIATLQFNCHISLLVVLIAVFYSLISKNSGSSSKNSNSRGGGGGDYTRYRPLGGEMQMQQLGDDDDGSRFTLDSDGDEEGNGDGEAIEELENVVKVRGDHHDSKNNVRANGHGGIHQ